MPPQIRRWAFLIVPAARKYHLNPNLIAAVMTQESNGDPSSVSPANAVGLMQVLDGPFNPKRNVYMGAAELATDLAQFHSIKLALAAYNAGPGAVLEYGGVPPYRETQDYVVVVAYLFSLYNRHGLTPQRKAQYSSSLKDLRHFKSQSKKVAKLARIGHVRIGHADRGAKCHHVPRRCAMRARSHVLFQDMDPFWPLAGSPDPLQRVAPNAVTR